VDIAWCHGVPYVLYQDLSSDMTGSDLSVQAALASSNLRCSCKFPTHEHPRVSKVLIPGQLCHNIMLNSPSSSATTWRSAARACPLESAPSIGPGQSDAMAEKEGRSLTLASIPSTIVDWSSIYLAARPHVVRTVRCWQRSASVLPTESRGPEIWRHGPSLAFGTLAPGEVGL
jgi:hypothetical protein